MSTINKITSKGTSYDIEDSIAREELDNKLDKSALLDAGIKSITWSTARSEISVITVEDPYKSQRPSGTNTRYWGEFEACANITHSTVYRVTFNGTVYDNLVCQYGILNNDGTAGKHPESTESAVAAVWTMIGNRYLFDSRYTNTGEPFCIMDISHGGMNVDGSYYYGYKTRNGILFTSNASTNIIKIEIANITQEELPKSLFDGYGRADKLYQNVDGSSYSGTSLGQGNIVNRNSFAIGNSNVSTGFASFSIGLHCESKGAYSTAIGFKTQANGDGSFAQGLNMTDSSGVTLKTMATGIGSISLGTGCNSSGNASFAIGSGCTSSGFSSGAIGNGCTSTRNGSIAEGYKTQAIGNAAHSEGQETIASSTSQHVQGKYNIEDTSNVYAHIVGNGSKTARSNAHTLDWNGNAWYQGKVESASGVLKLGNTEVTETQLQALLALLNQ